MAGGDVEGVGQVEERNIKDTTGRRVEKEEMGERGQRNARL